VDVKLKRNMKKIFVLLVSAIALGSLPLTLFAASPSFNGTFCHQGQKKLLFYRDGGVSYISKSGEHKSGTYTWDYDSKTIKIEWTDGDVWRGTLASGWNGSGPYRGVTGTSSNMDVEGERYCDHYVGMCACP
jgi:hypothetical protein